MSKQPIQVIIRKEGFFWPLTKWTVRMAFRFFLGRPMNGQKNDNSKFLTGATRFKPGIRHSRWRKKPHLHRALLRGAVFWPLLGLLALAVWSRTAALIAVACTSLPLLILAYRKGRLLFFDPFHSTDVGGHGERSQHWILKNKYRVLMRMQPIPGYVTKAEKFDPDIAPEIQEAIRRDINAELPFASWPVLGTVTRYRRDRKAVSSE